MEAGFFLRRRLVYCLFCYFVATVISFYSYASDSDEKENILELEWASSFFIAIEKNNLKKVQEILDSKKAGEDINFVDYNYDERKTIGDGLTPLGFAAKNGFVEIAEELVNRGAIIDKRDTGNCPPPYVRLLRAS